jgi:nucleotidyltransferase/DNA polymerase involved in DNA repair
MELFLSSDDCSATPEELAWKIAEGVRNQVFETTQCTATVGVASNKLLAKLAADQAKPNKSLVVQDYRALLEPLNLRDLHGIGHRMERKLTAENIISVSDVWDLGDNAESELIRILGPGLGRKIWLFCNGVDDRPVQPAERKTIGAEVRLLNRFERDRSFIQFTCFPSMLVV